MRPVSEHLCATLRRHEALDILDMAHRYEGVLPETRLDILAASTGKLHPVRIDGTFTLQRHGLTRMPDAVRTTASSGQTFVRNCF
jgi:hypothetical protein